MSPNFSKFYAQERFLAIGVPGGYGCVCFVALDPAPRFARRGGCYAKSDNGNYVKLLVIFNDINDLQRICIDHNLCDTRKPQYVVC